MPKLSLIKNNRKTNSKRTIQRHARERTIGDLSLLQEVSAHQELLRFQANNVSLSQALSNSTISLCSGSSDESTNIVNFNISSMGNNVEIGNPNNVEIENSLRQTHYSSNNTSYNLQSVHLDLQKWAISNNISHSVLNKLLNGVLRKHFPDSKFPKDARTLLATCKKDSLSKLSVTSNNFIYFGIKSTISYMLKKHRVILKHTDSIKLAINIDGLPISKSTGSQFWPLLGCIKSIKTVEKEVFLLGIFHGYEKPENSDILLNDFVTECQQLNNKICINNLCVDFGISLLICDSPAKSLVLKIKYPTGYYSCPKCFIEGIYNNRNVSFVNSNNVAKRTDLSFRQRIQPEHHQNDQQSLIEKIPNFDMIKNVALDYMHIVCLGVVKRILAHKTFGFVFGSPPYKLRASDIVKINLRLQKCRNFVPMEFSRKTRGISESKRFKATEFRTFLVYVGPVVLKKILLPERYTNFVILSVAISILISARAYDNRWLNYAEELIECFMTSSKLIYSRDFFSLNIHLLTHLAEVCREFGPLGNFDAFNFENHMQILLKQVRKAHKPLQQVVRRTLEEQRISQCISEDVSQRNVQSGQFKLNQSHSDGPLIENCIGPQYKKVCNNSVTVSCNLFANRVVQLDNGVIFEVLNFCYDSNTHDLIMVGKTFKKVGNLFERPCQSSLLDISIVQPQSESLVSYSYSQFQNKLFILPYNEISDTYVVFPLVHLIQN